MPKICYQSRNFSASSLQLIEQATEIIEEYVGQGFDLTLRQLYYQMVARDIIPNTLRSYKRMGSIVNDARLAGLIDWNRIQDLTRELRQNSHWDSPEQIVKAVSEQYAIDKWEGQKHRVEVWVEKDALRNIVERACRELDIAFFVCRGYTSQSEMHVAAMRLCKLNKAGYDPIIFHLGDHDPSGIDMTRDIQDRLELFGAEVEVKRLALNMDQVEEYSPPPNPAKETDSRHGEYQKLYGDESWELDALSPEVLANIISQNVSVYRDDELYSEREDQESSERSQLEKCSNHWEGVCGFLKKQGRKKKD